MRLFRRWIRGCTKLFISLVIVSCHRRMWVWCCLLAGCCFCCTTPTRCRQTRCRGGGYNWRQVSVSCRTGLSPSSYAKCFCFWIFDKPESAFPSIKLFPEPIWLKTIGVTMSCYLNSWFCLNTISDPDRQTPLLVLSSSWWE